MRRTNKKSGRMKFLICGLGSMGYRHLRSLRKLGDFGIWAYSTGKSTIEQHRKEENPPDRVFDSLELALNAGPDAALVTNPTFLHLEVAQQIVERGIPIFIDKPLDCNLRRVENFKTTVEEKQIPVLIGFNLMFHPAILKISELLENQVIGDVITASAHWGAYLPEWHPWEDYKKCYSARSDMGGGVVLTMCHELNYLTHFFGKINKCIAMELTKRKLNISAEEGVDVLMKHESGVHSNVHLSFAQKPERRSLDIVGEKGNLHWDSNHGASEIIVEDGQNRQVYTFEDNDIGTTTEQSYYNEMMHFISVAQKMVESRVPLTKGIEDLELCITILKEIDR